MGCWVNGGMRERCEIVHKVSESVHPTLMPTKDIIAEEALNSQVQDDSVDVGQPLLLASPLTGTDHTDAVSYEMGARRACNSTGCLSPRPLYCAEHMLC